MVLTRTQILDVIANGGSVLIGDILYKSGDTVPDQSSIDTIIAGVKPPNYVVNTGNAAVGDVKSGKTFSSVLLTNAVGTLP